MIGAASVPAGLGVSPVFDMPAGVFIVCAAARARGPTCTAFLVAPDPAQLVAA